LRRKCPNGLNISTQQPHFLVKTGANSLFPGERVAHLASR
jgi:hypothetical protein